MLALRGFCGWYFLPGVPPRTETECRAPWYLDALAGHVGPAIIYGYL